MISTRDQLVYKQNVYCVLHVQCILSYNRLFPHISCGSSEMCFISITDCVQNKLNVVFNIT
jgi:hypothetical protein